ncbi:MAG TPA: DUF4272 domain-containing protein [Micromonosporaceae bacterium]|jgi:hypothetical protein
MTAPAPDPHRVRATSIETLRRLDLPTPPAQFPVIWEPGDGVELRPPSEIEGRAAILNVVYARCYGMPGEAAMAWLLDAHLLDHLTKPEWNFLASSEDGKHHPSFTLHLEAIYALAWLLGLVAEIDPAEPAPDGLIEKMPHLPSKEAFSAWRDRANPTLAPAPEAAAALDLVYCLDWAYLEAERRQIRLPGLVHSKLIAQRRWALEWAVTFRGPYQDPPRGWEEINLDM